MIITKLIVILYSLLRALSIGLFMGSGGIIMYFPKSSKASVGHTAYKFDTFWYMQAIQTLWKLLVQCSQSPIVQLAKALGR
jgi:uncharacterized membrane protein